MINDLRTAINRARIAEDDALQKLPQKSLQLQAIERLATCVRDVGWRWREVAELITERDQLAAEVARFRRLYADLTEQSQEGVHE